MNLDLSSFAPLHMGALHAYEQFLVYGLAFGPFIVLGVVVWFVRRRDLAEEGQAPEEMEAAEAVRSTHRQAT